VEKKDQKTMSHIMKTSEMVHQQMEAIQTEIDQTLFVASSGDDAVRLTLNGKHELIDIQLSEDALKLAASTLSTFIIEAHCAASAQVAKATREKIISLADRLSDQHE
jgi:DNA-binding protein YbaB